MDGLDSTIVVAGNTTATSTLSKPVKRNDPRKTGSKLGGTRDTIKTVSSSARVGPPKSAKKAAKRSARGEES